MKKYQLTVISLASLVLRKRPGYKAKAETEQE